MKVRFAKYFKKKIIFFIFCEKNGFFWMIKTILTTERKSFKNGLPFFYLIPACLEFLYFFPIFWNFYMKIVNLCKISLPMQQRQRRLFCINKYQLRLLVGRAEGQPMPTSTFSRWWREQKLNEVLNMTELEFCRAHWFYCERYQLLKEKVGFEDEDVLSL